MTTATQEAVVYKTKIVLGAPAKDIRAGIEGHVYGINFHSKGCVDVILQWFKDGESKLHFIPEDRFVSENELTDAPDQEYRTTIEADKKYRDTQTGLEGWAATIQFFDHMATRVELRRLGEKEGMQKIVYNSVDDFLLEPVDVPKRKSSEPTGKRSPTIKEERYR